MKAKYLKISKLSLILIGLLYACLNSLIVHGGSQVEMLLEEARQSANIGDLENAAKLYQQVLALEKNHPDAKNELAVVLIGTQVSDTYTEESEKSMPHPDAKNTTQP